MTIFSNNNTYDVVVSLVIVLVLSTTKASANHNGSNITYETIKGWEPSQDVVGWEMSTIEAWANTPDCLPSTGICNNCGIGAIVVELDDNINPSFRTYQVGAGGTTSPWNYNAQSFEIASFTKIFTALTMQIQINEGTIRPDTTVREYLPECDWSSALSSQIESITVLELVQQTSGLPAQPPNRAGTGSPGDNPFGGYSIDMLCDSLLNLSGLPTRGRFSYSNYAFGIAGLVMSRAEEDAIGAPVTYEDLVKAKILLPFQMKETVVRFDMEQDRPAVGCQRGLQRSQPTIRVGEYGVLQGNGAFRSTLKDMGSFIEQLMLNDLKPPTEVAAEANKNLRTDGNTTDEQLTTLLKALDLVSDTGHVDEACTCVSNWCEGWLCPLPNPVEEFTTLMGTTTFTSALQQGQRKSGDTGGYSLRGVWSSQKRRGAFAVDTCGGCGSNRGTSGSAVQRLALLLADGPPQAPSYIPPRGTTDAPSPSPLIERFQGEISSHAFPSNAAIEVELRQPGIHEGDLATVLVASSDGQGCTSPAVPFTTKEGLQGWELQNSALYGCGWAGGHDPLNDIPQSRKLIVLPNDGGAVLQEMGVDIYLKNTDSGNGNNNSTNNDDYVESKMKDGSDNEVDHDNDASAAADNTGFQSFKPVISLMVTIYLLMMISV